MFRIVYFLLFTAFFSIAQASIGVGEIIALDGKATIKRDNKTLTPKIGFELFKEDIIKTEKKSKLQLLFNDNTSVSIGHNSTMSISEYFFDDKNNSKAQFNFAKGVFKTITGKIGKIAPSKFKLKTKSASIGIRGTTIIVFTGKKGDQISCTSGAINVRSKLGQVYVPKGFKTRVVQNKAPAKPKKYTKKEFQNMEKRFKIKKKKKEQRTSVGGPVMLESTKKLTLTPTKEKSSTISPKLQDQKLSRTPTLDPKNLKLQPTKLDPKTITKTPKIDPNVNRSLSADLKLLDNSLKTGSAVTPLNIPSKPIDTSTLKTTTLQPTSSSKTLDSSITNKLNVQGTSLKTTTPLVPTSNLKSATPIVPTKAISPTIPTNNLKVTTPLVPTTKIKTITPVLTPKVITPTIQPVVPATNLKTITPVTSTK